MSINSFYEYLDFVATTVIALNKTAKFIELSHMLKKSRIMISFGVTLNLFAHN